MTEADLVITIADSMRGELVRRGAPEDRTFVVPNIVDVQRFQPRERSADVARRYGLEGRPVLGCISNLGQREGIDHLISAIAILRERGRDIAGLIVGDGPERERLSIMISELGLEEHVLLTGHVPNTEIEDHYSLIDVFVVPRVEDRASRLVTPLKPLEAMAMGRPVIVSDLPALRELVDPPSRGLAFPSSDPVGLADAAITVLDDSQLQRRFTENALEWVRAERTVESNALRYKDILDHVL